VSDERSEFSHSVGQKLPFAVLSGSAWYSAHLPLVQTRRRKLLAAPAIRLTVELRMKFPTKTLCLMGALALASGATGVLAQDAGMQPSHDMGNMTQKEMGKHDMMHSKMPSMHTMPATVTSVDLKTGIVEVSTEGMSLRMHFPPASVADLKTGDKITLHMGFSK
jgi:uncharacterized protein involved in copper resistance